VTTISADPASSADRLDYGPIQPPMLTHAQVRGFLKQRFPLLMVDTVLLIDPGARVVAVKNVAGNELQFLGHFPDFPLMPGALIIESLAQTATFLSWNKGGGDSPTQVQYLGGANINFYKPVYPGDQMVNEVRQTRRLRNLQIVSAITRVGQTVVARGELILAAQGQS